MSSVISSTDSVEQLNQQALEQAHETSMRQRAQALAGVYVLFSLLVMAYVPYVAVSSSYDGRRLPFILLLAGISVFMVGNAVMARRGHIDASILLVGGGIILGPMFNVLGTSELKTSMWLITVACLLPCFATRPRQASFLGALALSALALSGWWLRDVLPHELLFDEFGRAIFLTSSFSVMAYQVCSAHRDMLSICEENFEAGELARRMAEQERREAEHERVAAEDASRAKSQFLANMSHELRTPLNAIHGYAGILHEELTDLDNIPSEVHNDAQRIQQASRHLIELIRDVLDLSDIESGTLEYTPRIFDLREMCRDIVTSMELAASTQQNCLKYADELETTQVHLDPTWIRQILFNLLSNSAKFTRDGVITLRASRASDGAVVLEVQDSGVGMSDMEQERIFEEFMQASASTLHDFGGTGLGLPLCHRLTLEMGGLLELESKLGHGTLVTVSLPQAKEGTHRD